MASARIIKAWSLVILVLQNVTLVLFMRHTRTVSGSGPRYLASTAVTMAEVLKVTACVGVLLWECSGSVAGMVALLHRQVWQEPVETLKILVPALLYTLQNNLLYLAVSNLPAATFQVTYQLKIITTAMFSVLLLGRQLSRQKWISLVLLTAGVSLVQLSTAASATKKSLSSGTDSPTLSMQMVGLGAVIASTMTSGFAGVFFEKLMKDSSTSLWVRNFVLSFSSVFLGLAGVFVNDFDAIVSGGFFQGYTPLVWVVIVNSAFGGLVVAVVVKFADNIVKGFAMSISIIISSVIAFFLFSFSPSPTWLLGGAIVLAATFLYQLPDEPPKPSPLPPLPFARNKA